MDSDKDASYYARIALHVYHLFEIVIIIVLGLAVASTIYDIILLMISRSPDAPVLVLQNILLTLVYVDLMRTITASLVEKVFRIDILLEALIIAITRDLIGALALVQEKYDATKLATLVGLLTVVALLWYATIRVLGRKSEGSSACSPA